MRHCREQYRVWRLGNSEDGAPREIRTLDIQLRKLLLFRLATGASHGELLRSRTIATRSVAHVAPRRRLRIARLAVNARSWLTIWCAPRGSNPDTSDQESDALPLGLGAHGRNGRNRTGDSPARGERVITTPRLCGCGGRTRTAAGTAYEAAALPLGDTALIGPG